MQPVVVGVNLPRVFQEGAGRIGLAEIDPGLRRTEVETNISLCGFRQPAVKIRSFLLLARKLVGIGELRLHVRRLGTNHQQSRERQVVLALLAILAGDCTQNFLILRRTGFRSFQVAFSVLILAKPLVSVSDKQISMGRRLDHIRTLQQLERAFWVSIEPQLSR